MPVSVMYLNLNALKHSGLIFQPVAANFHCINFNLNLTKEWAMEFSGMEKLTPKMCLLLCLRTFQYPGAYDPNCFCILTNETGNHVLVHPFVNISKNPLY